MSLSFLSRSSEARKRRCSFRPCALFFCPWEKEEGEEGKSTNKKTHARQDLFPKREERKTERGKVSVMGDLLLSPFFGGGGGKEGK